MLNRSSLFRVFIIAVVISLIVLSIPGYAQKWSSECEEQYKESISEECRIMVAKGIWKDCLEQDEGK